MESVYNTQTVAKTLEPARCFERMVFNTGGSLKQPYRPGLYIVLK